MSPTAKDTELITPGTETAAVRPDPVALEVPVTVNGARTVEGSDKREPFSESTKTVLVFGNGAVIRLASTVAPGQLLFLTNDNTKKEVVCQVVKSKNYRSVSGYVELEFTEAVSGFWGMRFPEERLASQISAPATKAPAPASGNAAKPVENRPPVVPAAAQPTETSFSQPKTNIPVPNVAAQPAAKVEPLISSAPKTESSKPAPVTPSRVTDTQTITSLPKSGAPADARGLGVTSLPRGPEVKPAEPVVTQTKPPTSTTQTSMEALKLESARLQETLSTLSFHPSQLTPASSKPALTNPPAGKVIEIAKKDAVRAPASPVAKTTPVKLGSSLDSEEVKIPSWLEPLARNAATPAPQDTASKEHAPDLDETEIFEVQDLATVPTSQETTVSSEPIVDPGLISEGIAVEKVSRGSVKGIWIAAIAAGIVVVAAGGAWYVRNSSSPAQTSVAEAAAPAPVAASPVSPPQAQSSAPVRGASNAPLSSAASSQQQPKRIDASSVEAIRSNSGSSSNSGASSYAAQELATYKQMGEPQPKKPSLGTVRLATPSANRGAVPTENGEAPALNEGHPSVNGSDLGGGIVPVDSKQPAAPPVPLPVGGDVKPAHLISSVQPVYPTLARNQHVGGDVKIDALVDENGRVSQMKVVSGPTLLHQAAMDALRQWKYQSATLDGKPVSMHLTVTVQFRLQ